MASMEIFDGNCDTGDCASRAFWAVRDKVGVVAGKHCRKHAPAALKARDKYERENFTSKEAPPLKGAVER